MKKYHPLFLILLFFTNNPLFSQCFGADVESGNLSAYQTFIGSIGRTGNLNFDIGNAPNRIKVLNKLEGYDLIADQYCLNRLPVVSPDGGLYAIRLGNSDAGGEAQKVTLNFIVEENLPFFLLQYAVVLNDPQHHFHEQPRFELRILDKFGNSLDGCGAYNVRAGNNIPGFENCSEGWKVRPWTTVGFELTDYIGQEISIEILVTDCALGGHAGYAYIDATCKPLGVDIEGYCPGNNALDLRLTEGFQDYEWSTGATTPSITVDNPIVGNIYSVTVTNVTGCQLVINDTIPPLDSFPPPSLDTLPSLRICKGDIIKIVPTGKDLHHIKNLNSGISADSFLLAPLENTRYTIVAYDKYKCKSDTVYFSIEIKDFLAADFNLEKDVFCAGEPIIFDRTSSGNIKESHWDFGDGTFTTDSLPTAKVYENTSVFPRVITITLTERNECSIDKISKRITINPINIVADFEIENGITEICVGAPICFFNLSTVGAEVSYLLGDGNTSNTLQTCHTYQTAGTYQISIIAISECGIDTMTKVLLVKPLPNLAIQQMDTIVCTGDTTQLTFTSTLPIMEQTWSLGQELRTTDFINVITHTSGEFLVNLQVLSENQCSNTTQTFLKVFPAPISEIIVDSLICLRDTVSINTIPENRTTYNWSIGDIHISNEASVTYFANNIGNLPISLRATNDYGCLTNHEKEVTIRPIPEPKFDIHIIDDCTPALVRFNNLTIENETTIYKWILNGETIAADSDTEYVVEEGGIYTIELLAINEHGCSNKINKEFRIKQTPDAAILAHERNQCGNSTIPLKAKPCDGCTFEWHTSDSVFVYNPNPNFAPIPGDKEILLITTKELCTDTAKTTISISEPLAITTSVEHNPCFGDAVGIIITEVIGGMPPYSYTWNDINTTKDLSNLSAGTYHLKVEDKHGCTVEDTVIVKEPIAPLSITKIDELLVSCHGGQDGAIEVQAAGGTEPYHYQWQNNSQNQRLTDVQAGRYIVTITDANDCIIEDTFEVKQHQAIQLGNVISPITCFGKKDGELNLEHAEGGQKPYWGKIQETGTEGIIFQNLDTGDYMVIIEDALGCLDTNILTINQPEKTWIDIEQKGQVIKQGATIFLTTVYPINNPAINWLASNENGNISCTDCDATIVQPFQSTEYIVSLTDENNCTVYDSIFIEVEIDRGVFIPTAFSPQGAVRNQLFSPQANNPGIKQINSLRIFDRYGGIVHEALNFPVSAAPEYGWDGTVNGIVLTSDNYRYSIVLEYVDGYVSEKRGSIFLTR